MSKEDVKLILFLALTPISAICLLTVIFADISRAVRIGFSIAALVLFVLAGIFGAWYHETV